MQRCATSLYNSHHLEQTRNVCLWKTIFLSLQNAKVEKGHYLPDFFSYFSVVNQVTYLSVSISLPSLKALAQIVIEIAYKQD